MTILHVLALALGGGLLSTPKAFAEPAFELQSQRIAPLSADRRIKGRRLTWRMSSAQLMGVSSFEAQLEPGVTISVVRTKRSTEYSRDIWIGKIANDPFGRVVIASNPDDGGDIAMEIHAGGRGYTVLKTQNGDAIIETQPMSVDDMVRPDKAGGVRPRSSVIAKSSDQFIDVLLAYSDDAIAQNPNIVSVLTARMASVNEILSDSCASFRYRVVHIEPVTYNETGNFLTDLGCLYAWSDGCLDNLHTLRDTHGADLIQLALYQNSACGIARTNAIGSFDTVNAVSVVGILCGADTMAHEFAHNLGIMHDRYQLDMTLNEDSVNYGSGFGFVDLKNKHYTVMAYPDHCDDLGLSCTRLFQFSSPAFFNNGTALGIAHKVDAVSQMNENFGYVANFRSSLSSYDAGLGTSCQTAKAASDVNCFIATAAMGSYMNSEVVYLRTFRDRVLSHSRVGRLMIDWYYRFSPSLAYRLRSQAYLKSPVRFAIRATVFTLQNFIPLLFALALISLVALGFRASRLWVVSILTLFGMTGPRVSSALEASQSFLSDWIGSNPALRLEVPPRYQFGMEYSTGSSEIGSAVNKTTTDRQELVITLGTYGADAFFDVSASAIGNEQMKTEQESLGSVEEKGKWQSYSARVGLRTTSLGLWGLGYLSEKRTIDTDSEDRSKVSLGNKMAFGTIQVSGALHFMQEKGSLLAQTKWLEEQLAIGYLEGDTNPRFLFEYSISRRPSVLRRDISGFTARGEKWSHQIAVEYRSLGGWVENLALYGGIDKVSALADYSDAQEQWRVGIRSGILMLTTGELILGLEQNLPKDTSMPDTTTIKAGFSYHL